MLIHIIWTQITLLFGIDISCFLCRNYILLFISEIQKRYTHCNPRGLAYNSRFYVRLIKISKQKLGACLFFTGRTIWYETIRKSRWKLETKILFCTEIYYVTVRITVLPSNINVTLVWRYIYYVNNGINVWHKRYDNIMYIRSLIYRSFGMPSIVAASMVGRNTAVYLSSSF